MLHSGHCTLFNQQDFSSNKLTPNAYPIVIGYNGSNHFFPTTPSSSQEYNTWKIEHQVGPLLSAALISIQEIDMSSQRLTSKKMKSLQTVQDCLVDNLPSISKSANTFYLAKARVGVVPRGPVFAHPQVVSQVPLASLPQPSDPSPSGPDVPATPATGLSLSKGKKKRVYKPYLCTQCGIQKTRKNDLDGHLWTAHGLGEPIVCNMGECVNNSFSTRGSLKQHQRTKHLNKYKFTCNIKGCKWPGTESRDQKISHMATVHNKHLRHAKSKEGGTKYKKGGDRVMYICPKCNKHFKGPAQVKRHKWRGMCTVAKTHACVIGHCTKMYKTRFGLQRHVALIHSGETDESLKCPICHKQLANRGSLINHVNWHRQISSLKRAKQRTIARIYGKRAVRVTQSVPPKVFHST